MPDEIAMTGPSETIGSEEPRQDAAAFDAALAAVLPEDLSSWLRLRTRLAGLRLEDVAAEIGVSRSSVANYVRGVTRPDPLTLMRWVVLLSDRSGIGVPRLWAEARIVLLSEIQG